MAETVSKSIHNWRRYPSSKCYESDEKLWFGIRQSVVAPSDAAENSCNMGAQLQSLSCTTAPKIFLKIYLLYDFWGA